MPQIFADAVGLPLACVEQVMGDTDLTADAGKSSASRQTFVSGNAVRAAGLDLRPGCWRSSGWPTWRRPSVQLQLGGPRLVRDAPRRSVCASTCARLPADEHGDLFTGSGHFDPPTVPLDADGQGVPYATYGFAAQVAELEVDIELGSVKLLHIHAAHDVGRAINPTQVEGQVHGGIAQGIGLALMEEYVNGRTDNLHDYLIPTFGDVPPITVHLVEDPEPLGPWGAKGVGEPALVATAPAILTAIHARGGRADGSRAGHAGRLRAAMPRASRPGAADDRLAMSTSVPPPAEFDARSDGQGVAPPVVLEHARAPERMAADKVRCDACPVLCQISPGKLGACDRYGNVDGVLDADRHRAPAAAPGQRGGRMEGAAGRRLGRHA